jgi:hypothetical protein
MIATTELLTLTTQRCRECGTHHLVRVEAIPDDRQVTAALVGFFDACPRTGGRVWFVVQAPAGGEPTRLLRFGPLEDNTWEPDGDAFVPSRGVPVGIGSDVPPSGMNHGGFHEPARRPDLLRRAWGCPFHP